MKFISILTLVCVLSAVLLFGGSVADKADKTVARGRSPPADTAPHKHKSPRPPASDAAKQNCREPTDKQLKRQLQKVSGGKTMENRTLDQFDSIPPLNDTSRPNCSSFRLDLSASDPSKRALCPHYLDSRRYPDLYPRTLVEARCLCHQCRRVKARTCQQIYGDRTVLRRGQCDAKGLYVYTPVTIRISIGCI